MHANRHALLPGCASGIHRHWSCANALGRLLSRRVTTQTCTCRLIFQLQFAVHLDDSSPFLATTTIEGSHPLWLQGWNRLTVELTTHSRDGLTESDFSMAAKLNAVPKDDLLSKKKAAAAAPSEGS